MNKDPLVAHDGSMGGTVSKIPCTVKTSTTYIPLESRWCPIFKAIVAGFRGKVAPKK